MEKRRVDEIISEVATQVEQEGWVRDAAQFETTLVEHRSCITKDKQYDRMILEKEYKFLKNQWEISLDYSINATGTLGRALRKVVQKVSKIVLSRFVQKQNAVNFSNLQSMHQIQLFIEQSQAQNQELQKKCSMLECRIAELEKLNQKSMNEGM